MIQAGWCKVPDLDETARGPVGLPCSQCRALQAEALTSPESLLDVQDGRPTADLLSQNLSYKKIPRLCMCTWKFEKHWSSAFSLSLK